ncbi:MAG: hypothetical protein PHV82_12615 [Victivallaceae bacterium]|nr:hypothetical protein [Victivallaceae bacterium]
MSERDRIELKFWQGEEGGILDIIARLADAACDLLESRLAGLPGETDPELADLRLVELLGWERDTERFSGEPEALFRKRVKYALANAKDAGSRAGFARIWQRLGLGTISQTERFDAENWDVIKLEVEEAVFVLSEQLLSDLIRQYGRTCRRYAFESKISAAMGVRAFDFDHITLNSKATI